MQKTIISPAQCRAARGLLNWTQIELAEKAKVAKQTLADFEKSVRKPYDRTLHDIQKTLEDAGVEFIEGNGIRLKG
jgi:transcriptional regulator with XRE-family HTH domain